MAVRKNEIQRTLSTIERQKLLFALTRQNDHIDLPKGIKGDIEDVHKGATEIGEEAAKLQLGGKHHEICL